MAEHMGRMKHQAIVGNIGHFDNEIDMAGLAASPGIVRIKIKPQVHEWRFPDGHTVIVLSEGRLLNLGNATGHPSFVMSNSFTNQVLAQIELFTKTEDYPVGVYTLPKQLDEHVARLHLDALGVRLTTLTKEQASYLGVPVDGPYKPDTTATDGRRGTDDLRHVRSGVGQCRPAHRLGAARDAGARPAGEGVRQQAAVRRAPDRGLPAHHPGDGRPGRPDHRWRRRDPPRRLESAVHPR